jgi:hypothetical protein
MHPTPGADAVAGDTLPVSALDRTANAGWRHEEVSFTVRRSRN